MFPIRFTWQISPILTSCSSFSLSFTCRTAPLFPTFTPCVFKYSGRSSLRGVIIGRTSRFTGLRRGRSNSARCSGSSAPPPPPPPRLAPRQVEQRQLQRLVRLLLRRPPRLVGQTDPHQRAPRTLRRIHQRRRNLSRFRQVPRPQDQRLRLRDQRLVEHHPYALPRRAVVRDPFVAPVPTLPQADSLDAELRPVRRPQFRSEERRVGKE